VYNSHLCCTALQLLLNYALFTLEDLNSQHVTGCERVIHWSFIFQFYHSPQHFHIHLNWLYAPALRSTNWFCSHDNSTMYGTVWWADGRSLLSVVLWLWLSAVLHWSWVVMGLTALHWKEGWRKPPAEPTDSKEVVKCWE